MDFLLQKRPQIICQAVNLRTGNTFK